MGDGLQLSAKSVSRLLAQIFGPAIYDLPRFGGGGHGHLIDLISGPHPDPWRSGPQPDPWRRGPWPDPWRIALTLADAHIEELLAQDRVRHYVRRTSRARRAKTVPAADS